MNQSQYRQLKEALALKIRKKDLEDTTRKFDALCVYLAKASDDREAIAVFEAITTVLTSTGPGVGPLSPVRQANLSGVRSLIQNQIDKANRLNEVAAVSSSPWSERSCFWCGTTFLVHRDWRNKPSRCKECSQLLNVVFPETKPVKPESVTYNHNVVFRGGSPGSGKRR